MASWISTRVPLTDQQNRSSAEFQRRCQKPDHDRIGNWMARRVSRPAALRITRVVAPLGLSANAVTLAAWLLGISAATALAWGSTAGWLLAALLLQTWYLLDHVDGQLARFTGSASLDGAQLDFLMHHTIHLLVPIGAGCGLLVRDAEPLWALAGLVWGLAMLLITLQHDARYKAFVVRLKRLHGRLEVVGGGGGRPEPPAPLPPKPLHAAAWLARKSCEMHVVMNLVALIALAEWICGLAGAAIRAYLGLMPAVALTVAIATILRSQQRGSTEMEFGQWFRVPDHHALAYRDGWWFVEDQAIGQVGSSGATGDSEMLDL